jgi:diguanylate cyclase (GGDEF)-like protein/PAS domain S-box-containing protein
MDLLKKATDEPMPPNWLDEPGPTQMGKGRSPLIRALWAVLVYLVVGLLWITFSDRIAELWFPDPGMLSRVQTWKGYLFVVVTGLVLFLVLFRQLSKDRLLLNLQHHQRQALRQREHQLTVLMDNLPGMAYRCLYDRHWTMMFVSGGCLEVTGYKPEELVHNHAVAYADLIDPMDADRVAEEVALAVNSGESFSVEYAITRKDGRKICVWERGCSVDVADGRKVLEGIMLDISDRKALEQELEELATTDPLTGLLNRREFGRVLDEELARSARYHHCMALLWIDFDHFKEVNDTWGHAAGDNVLCSVSRLLESSVRSMDSVARFGGEELVIVLPEMGVIEAGETAERLRARVHELPIRVADERDVHISISVGVAVYPDHGQTAGDLCAAADRAMYQAKSRGRDCVVQAT